MHGEGSCFYNLRMGNVLSAFTERTFIERIFKERESLERERLEREWLERELLELDRELRERKT